jgi:hypothetical protein
LGFLLDAGFHQEVALKQEGKRKVELV